MTANQVYFYRNRGTWNWQVRFELMSWLVLWRADVSVVTKVCISMLIFAQRILGPFQMWTNVRLQESANLVRHSTKLIKFGFTIYRSEKIFFLSENGFEVRLEGKEYFWPLNFVGIPFPPTTGAVDASTTRASYQMPLAGTVCSCQAVLEIRGGSMDIATPWMKGRFSLTEASNKKLRERFDQS